MCWWAEDYEDDANSNVLKETARRYFFLLIIYNNHMDGKEDFDIKLPTSALQALKIEPSDFPVDLSEMTIHDICTVGCSSEHGVRHTAPVSDAISTIVAVACAPRLPLQAQQWIRGCAGLLDTCGWAEQLVRRE